MVENSHCHISASGRSFLSFKVVKNCLLICSDIPDGSYVSFLSHCDITPIVVNWCMQKTPAGFDESFACNDPVFVI